MIGITEEYKKMIQEIVGDEFAEKNPNVVSIILMSLLIKETSSYLERIAGCLERIAGSLEKGVVFSMDDLSKPKPSKSFEEALRDLINCYSLENASNTPDFLLSEYLLECLKIYNKIIRRRAEWYNVQKESDRSVQNDQANETV